MYQFAGLLNRPETHDVVFTVPNEGASAGFCKTLLLGVSEVWSRRDEGWEEAEDKSGCVVHVVDLEPDTAQVVLDALQAAVFIGKLPDCPWKVLLQVARLADAELMSIVIDLVATALGNYKWADSEMPLIEQVLMRHPQLSFLTDMRMYAPRQYTQLYIFCQL